MSKTVFVFDTNALIKAEDAEKLKADVKKQIDEGVLFLNDALTFVDAVDVIDGERVELVENKPEKLKLTRRACSEIGISELKKEIAAGHGADIIRPFDEIAFTLTTGEKVSAVCAAVNEHGARFILKDCLREPWVMNKENTNEGGYLNSEMRRHVLKDVLPTFPEELREALAPRTMYETIDGEENTYSDTLWLPSATDAFGAGDYWAEERDSEQLPIFERERDRVKEREGYGTASWWLRSPRASNSSIFVRVSTGGTVYHYYACYSYGVAPGFDL